MSLPLSLVTIQPKLLACGVACEFDHLLQIDNLPKEGSLDYELDVVLGSTVKFEAHVHLC